MYIEGLDQIDNKILTELEKNARASYSEIGERVELTRVSVKKRMEAMENKGVIRGYKVIVDDTKASEGRLFFIDIETEPETFEDTAEILASYGIIRKIYAVTGECRLRVEGYALSNMRYEMFMKSMKRQLEGIRLFSVQDVLYTIKDPDGGIHYERNKKQSDSKGREGNL